MDIVTVGERSTQDVTDELQTIRKGSGITAQQVKDKAKVIQKLRVVDDEIAKHGLEPARRGL